MGAVSFEGQVAIVTGGGRGLGRAYCVELARRGASVVVNDVSAEHATEVVAEILGAGGTAVASYDDIATPEGGEALVKLALDRFGTIDALINNAGILRNNYFEDLGLDQIDAVLDVNLRGAFFVTQPAWRIMKAKGYGRVVLTSSAAGLFSRPGSVNYSSAKAGLYGMCRALSFEGADHGITINAVLPRATTTITHGDPPPGLVQAFPAALREALAPRLAPHVSAPLVCYLASRACTVNGEAFTTGYGRYARVFVGLAPGWLAPDPNAITIENVVENLDTIRDLNGYSVPAGNHTETEEVVKLLDIDVGSNP